MTPIGNKLLVRPETGSHERMDNGVVIPAGQGKANNVAVVMSVGTGVEQHEDVFWPGRMVLLPDGHKGVPVVTAGVTMYLICADDILAVID